MRKQVGFFLFSCLMFFSLQAQQTEVFTSDYAEYQHGIKLFNQNEYQAAQRILDRLHERTQKADLKSETAYFSALSAVYLRQHDAEKMMMAFVNDYPESPRTNSVYNEVAKYYFQNGDYVLAGKWYKRVTYNNLSSAEKRAYNFNLGYIEFKAGNTHRAKDYFNKVKNDAKYGSQAKYYLGYLAYEGEDYKQAAELFEGVDEADKADKKVSYFQSNISFNAGEFEKAIAQAKDQLPKSNKTEQSELNKIIGESYFNLKQYEEAIPYLEKYEGKNRRWSNTDYYQLGYAHYKMKDYEKAVSQFNKIIDGKDDVAQNAYYHLGECYVHLGQKTRALNAFKNASEMNFVAPIKEDATLNYARLSYEVGNSYESVPEVLNRFLKTYPKSPFVHEIQSLLVDSYVTSKNYEKAMELMDKNIYSAEAKVYQQVAFLYGLELYEDGNYLEARKHFEKSLSRTGSDNYEARATYWKAESNYNLENYKDAAAGYLQFKNLKAAKQTPEYKDIDYNLGYAFFTQKDYKKAGTYFESYTGKSGVDTRQKNDAYVRLGDSHFARSQFWQAMEEYNKAIAQTDIKNDYAFYQKAISYGFVDRNDTKIQELNSFLNKYPQSIYKDDALYELGNTYVAQDKNTKALEAYERLITEVPASNFVPQTLMKQGLIYYNTNANDKALAKFKKVVADYPNSDEARQAVNSARNIYVDTGKIDEYAAWVKNLDFVEVTDADIDNATYESAENQLIDGKDKAAISSFNSYLNKFPKGLHALPAHYHLAQLYYKNGDFSKAEPHYVYVVDKPGNEFTEKSLEHLARIYLGNKNYSKAVPVLLQLEQNARLRENITFAQSNLMKAYYEQKNYTKTVSYAEMVLADEKAGEQAKSDAQIFIARSAIQTGQESKAKAAYAEVALTARGILAAEAQYYDAYFKRKEGKFQESNESVQVLAAEYSGYREFSVKGLLLMGSNFYDLGDAYQATYILQNIIDNFDDYPDVAAQAAQKLNEIKAEEAKTNYSVETE